MDNSSVLRPPRLPRSGFRPARSSPPRSFPREGSRMRTDAGVIWGNKEGTNEIFGECSRHVSVIVLAPLLLLGCKWHQNGDQEVVLFGGAMRGGWLRLRSERIASLIDIDKESAGVIFIFPPSGSTCFLVTN